MNLSFRKLEKTIVGTVDGKPFTVANTPENIYSGSSQHI